jgi:hypothetical protein
MRSVSEAARLLQREGIQRGLGFRLEPKGYAVGSKVIEQNALGGDAESQGEEKVGGGRGGGGGRQG